MFAPNENNISQRIVRAVLIIQDLFTFIPFLFDWRRPKGWTYRNVNTTELRLVLTMQTKEICAGRKRLNLSFFCLSLSNQQNVLMIPTIGFLVCQCMCQVASAHACVARETSPKKKGKKKKTKNNNNNKTRDSSRK